MAEHETLKFRASASRRRARGARSRRAASVAEELRSFYRSAAQLAAALGTSRDTLRAWTAETPPARPRVQLLETAELLLVLCRAARRYVASDHQVGDWTVTPDPRLHGASPAQALRRYGRDGLEVLLADLAVVTPPRPTEPVEIPTLDELRGALAAGLGAEAQRRIERIAAAEPIEFSDAALDAELRAVADES